MKKSLTIFVILFLVLVSACAPQGTNSAPSSINPGIESVSPTQTAQGPVPEISTTLPETSITSTPEPNSVTSDNQSTSATSITLEDNGKTFHYHVGDSFLLNLGSDVYDWNVSIDNQDIVALKVGVMVIRGAQGLYDALNPGTATLTAVGDPLCRQSSPPCGMPTILFKVTLVVN